MNIHLIGIGGVAMGGLAIALARQGHDVTGSDAGVYPPMSEMLESNGLSWQEPYSADALELLAKEKPGLQVVVGNAIPRGNPELECALALGLKLTSMPELIRELFLPGTHSVVVAGTHGKTTTSNLCAWLLEALGRKPGWMIGGRPFGLEQSLRAAAGAGANTVRPFVLEGDEYDTSFWDKRSKFFHYWPRTLVINHIEFDHADIFQSLQQIQSVFHRLCMLVPPDGRILANGDSVATLEALSTAWAPVVLFGSSEGCTYRLLNEIPRPAGSLFRLRLPAEQPPATWPCPARLQPERKGDEAAAEFSKRAAWHSESSVDIELETKLSGDYNGRNLLAAIAVMDHLGLDRKDVLSLIGTFTGPGRRMDMYHNKAGTILFDDFAHHPTAVRESLAALRGRFPGKRITALVEPRSNTSVRNVMQQEWIDALKAADGVIFGALHRPWKYKREELFSFQEAKEQLEASGTAFLQQDSAQEIASTVEALLRQQAPQGKHWQELGARAAGQQLVVIFSNGSFDGLLAKLRLSLKFEEL